MLDKIIKSIFGKESTESPSSEIEILVNQLVEEAAEGVTGYFTPKFTGLPTYEIIQKKDVVFKTQLMLWLWNKVLTPFTGVWYSKAWQAKTVHEALLNIMLRSTLSLSEEDIMYCLDTQKKEISFLLPMGLFIKQLKNHHAKQPFSEKMDAKLQQFHSKIQNYQPFKKYTPELQELLVEQSNEMKVILADNKDDFGMKFNEYITNLSPIERKSMYQFLGLFKTANGAKPSNKFLKETEKNYSQIGEKRYLEIISDWLLLVKNLKPKIETHESNYGGNPYTWTNSEFLQEVNSSIAKGIVWSLLPFAEKDPKLISLLTDVAEKCYQKLPGKGPAAAGVGNACIYVLAQSGLAGVSQLSRLKLRIKQSNTQELIEKYIRETAEKLDMSPDEIEDMAVSTYGLDEGKATHIFGEYEATVKIASVGKIDIAWSKAGKALKSEPSALKKDFAEELKEIKNAVLLAQKMLSVQRDRIDRSMIQNREWTWEKFNDYYAQHGLMSFLTKQLIWEFHSENQSVTVFWVNDEWVNLQGKAIENIGDVITVKMWHPVGKSAEEITAWREFMARHEIRQPIKQAYREIYLITEAEIRTRTYSNRMAAHILKQHQFNTLAKVRGWKYSLLGAYDKGYESDKAQINLSKYQLRAEFWVSEVNADDAWNDTGIWHYVSTDQVRFVSSQNDQPVNLIEVPALVFSEIMRDVDLFVGVASVGNDPEWRDNGGLVQYRDYWTNYSFGDLNELAKTRKEVLVRLVPRLKIAKVAEIKDKFMMVRGKFRTYKIHLGSGNILMEPNDQYLCIVPDRSAKTADTGKVFLPFEGDAILSIILSKAFLLADDDKITDETIIRQIRSN